MNINKLTFGMASCITTLALVNACATHKKEPIKDCSSIFESRYVGKSAKPNPKSADDEMVTEGQSKLATECKVLEVKLDDKNKCELVGSDKIDDISKSISEDKSGRIILIAPQEQLGSLSKITEKYLASTGFDLKKHFETDMFKSLNFPYKGMRCTISNKEVVVWSGDKKVILTIDNK